MHSMKYSIKDGTMEDLATGCLILPVWSKGGLTADAKAADAAGGGVVSSLIKAGDFQGELGESQLLYDPTGLACKRLLVVGAGDRKKFSARNCAKMLRTAAQAVSKLQAPQVHIAAGGVIPDDRNAGWLAARIAQEMEDACYRYNRTKSSNSSKNSKSKAVAIRAVSISPLPKAQRRHVEQGLKRGAAIGLAINRAKELGNLPGNICTPQYLANEAQELAAQHRSLTTKVLSEKQMAQLGMNTLLSVSAGSAEEAKMIVIKHKGANPASKPHVIVGKGITFDTGGISIKPSPAMDEMKFDMCGAASVIATMGCVAELNLSANVIGIVAAAENMPGSRATKPGDIVTSMSGKTVEILNTDAEGRLVLCDALTYAEQFNPKSIIDIATLTGAAVATFGPHANVLLGNNDKLAATLLECGEESLDRAWQLPLWDDYQSMLDSNFADLANIGGPKAGTITAACFLSRFVEKQKWAHLDIAGSAWNSGKEKGATGRPVGLLMQYLSQQ